MPDITRLLRRDRRRLAVSTLLILAAAAIGPDWMADPVPGIASEVIAVALLIIILPVVSIFAPERRFVIEVMATAHLGFVALARLFPASNFNLGNPDVAPLSSCVLFVLVLGATWALMTGPWLDRALPRVTAVFAARALSPLALRKLWLSFVPTPGHLDACPDPNVVSIDYAGPDRQVIRLIHWRPAKGHAEEHLHVRAFDLYRHIAYRTCYRDGQGAYFQGGTTTFRFEPRGDDILVETSHTVEALPVRLVLRGWLDDTVGRALDTRLGRIEMTQRRATPAPTSERLNVPWNTALARTAQSLAARHPTLAGDGWHEF